MANTSGPPRVAASNVIWPSRIAQFFGSRLENAQIVYPIRIVQARVSRLTERRFAFIAAEDGDEYFFPSTAVAPPGYDALAESDILIFESELNSQGSRARSVRIRRVAA